MRMALAMVWGRRLNTANLGRLVDDALATLEEFGEPGADAGQVVDGPLNDPKARLEYATNGVRRTPRVAKSCRAAGSLSGPSITWPASAPGSPNSSSVATASSTSRCRLRVLSRRPQIIAIAIRNCRTPVSNTGPPYISACCRHRGR